jgi:hypothetical protein
MDYIYRALAKNWRISLPRKPLTLAWTHPVFKNTLTVCEMTNLNDITKMTIVYETKSGKQEILKFDKIIGARILVYKKEPMVPSTSFH